MRLKGKTALITGGARGIGAATALLFSREGARVGIVDLQEEGMKALAEKAKSEGLEIATFAGDITKKDHVDRIVSQFVQKLGRIDILVNNAGTSVFADHRDLEALTAADFHKIYDLNVVGAYQMIRAAAPAMKAAGKGAVVNVSSIAAVTGIGSSIAYAASKGALNTMTLSLARALAPEIRVNAVCPGFIGTRWFSDRMDADGFQGMIDTQRRITPLKRAGAPEDIAESVVFFCAEGAEHITGETLITDAGMHLNMAPLTAR